MDGRLNQPREEQARRELGHTDVGSGLAWFLVGAFLLSIVSVGGVQHLGAPAGFAAGEMGGPRDAAPLRWAALLDEFPTDCSLERFERHLEGALVVGRWALPKVQLLLTGVFGVGNEQAYAGRDGWLFHRAGVDYLSGPSFLDPARLRARRIDADHCETTPQPDPIPAIRRFNEDLAARGIRLIVMPTPVKAVIHPDGFSRRYSRRGPPVQNPSFQAFLARLEAEGVLIDAVGAIVAVVTLEFVLQSEGLNLAQGLLGLPWRLLFGAVFGPVGGMILALLLRCVHAGAPSHVGLRDG